MNFDLQQTVEEHEKHVRAILELVEEEQIIL